MKNCKRCKREYDPSLDFIEDVPLLEALDTYIDIEYFCSSCLYELDKKFVLAALNWDPNT